ncbi:MAG TPA: hypothetical protein VFH88_14555 [Candidatus Krumholzibacteria bacterium]|nr:hypothetical protein [Candidatus Krumholzibacteria bacterium]
MRAFGRGMGYLWASPNTLLGLLFSGAALATGGRARRVDGVLESHGGIVAVILRRMVPLRGGASAMTLGHVVLGRDAGALERTRAHERAHVRQYEQWGPFFLLGYAGASLVAALRGRHYYLDNAFELAARTAATSAGGRLTVAEKQP